MSPFVDCEDDADNTADADDDTYADDGTYADDDTADDADDPDCADFSDNLYGLLTSSHYLFLFVECKASQIRATNLKPNCYRIFIDPYLKLHEYWKIIAPCRFQRKTAKTGEGK